MAFRMNDIDAFVYSAACRTVNHSPCATTCSLLLRFTMLFDTLRHRDNRRSLAAP